MSIITDLLSGGLKGLGDSVSSVIKDFKADPNKLVDADLRIKELTEQFQEVQLKLSSDLEQAYLKDTENARDSNVKIQESDKASWLSKNVAYMMDIFIMLLWGTLTSYLLIVMLKIVQKEQGVDYTAVTAIWGAVTAVATTVINFHRGSSRGSEDKSKQLEKMMNK